MTPSFRAPILAALVAIAVNAAMIAAGLADLAFASLLPIWLAGWAIQRQPFRALGFTFGKPRHYGLALALPLLVIGVLTAIAIATGAANVSAVPWATVRTSFVSAFVMTLVLGILTEEGFFRGWLFSALQRAGMDNGHVAIATAIAFALWHLPTVTMATEDALPLAQVPVLIANAVVIGATWGLLRAASGSILVTSVCHALWNAAVYALFGYGSTVGALGVANSALYGPESGVLGLALNLVVAVLAWRWWRRQEVSPASVAGAAT